jgi:hypothetical protein
MMEIPVHDFPVCIDFNPFMRLLEKQHGFNHRDYAGKFERQPNALGDIDSIPYQDFWHWCLDGPFNGLSRGGPNFMAADYLQAPDMPDFVRTILKHIFDACEGHPARVDDGIWFYVDW